MQSFIDENTNRICVQVVPYAIMGNEPVRLNSNKEIFKIQITGVLVEFTVLGKTNTYHLMIKPEEQGSVSNSEIVNRDTTIYHTVFRFNDIVLNSETESLTGKPLNLYPAILDEELEVRLVIRVDGEICYQFETLQLNGTMSCLRVLTADGNIYNEEPNLTRIRRAISEGKIVGYILNVYQK